MGGCASSNKTDQSHPINNQAAQRQVAKPVEPIKPPPPGSIAIFGSYDSGKSTLIRKLWLLYGESYTDLERRNFRKNLDVAVLDAIFTLLHAFLELYPPLPPPTTLTIDIANMSDDLTIVEETSPLANARSIEPFNKLASEETLNACELQQISNELSSGIGNDPSPPTPAATASNTTPVLTTTHQDSIPQQTATTDDQSKPIPPQDLALESEDRLSSLPNQSTPHKRSQPPSPGQRTTSLNFPSTPTPNRPQSASTNSSPLISPQPTLKNLIQHPCSYYLNNPEYLTTYPDPDDELITALYAFISLESSLPVSTLPPGIASAATRPASGTSDNNNSSQSSIMPASPTKQQSLPLSTLPQAPPPVFAPFLVYKDVTIDIALAQHILVLWEHPVFRYLYQTSHMLFKQSLYQNPAVHINNNNNSLVMLAQGYIREIAQGKVKIVTARPQSAQSIQNSEKLTKTQNEGEKTDNLENPAKSTPTPSFDPIEPFETSEVGNDDEFTIDSLISDTDLLLMKVPHFRKRTNLDNVVFETDEADLMVTQSGQIMGSMKLGPEENEFFEMLYGDYVEEQFAEYLFESNGFLAVNEHHQQELAQLEDNYVATIRNAGVKTNFSDVFRTFIEQAHAQDQAQGRKLSDIPLPVTNPHDNVSGTKFDKGDHKSDKDVNAPETRIARTSQASDPSNTPDAQGAPVVVVTGNVNPGNNPNIYHTRRRSIQLDTATSNTMQRTHSTLGPECYLPAELYSLDNVALPPPISHRTATTTTTAAAASQPKPITTSHSTTTTATTVPTQLVSLTEDSPVQTDSNPPLLGSQRSSRHSLSFRALASPSGSNPRSSVVELNSATSSSHQRPDSSPSNSSRMLRPARSQSITRRELQGSDNAPILKQPSFFSTIMESGQSDENIAKQNAQGNTEANADKTTAEMNSNNTNTANNTTESDTVTTTTGTPQATTSPSTPTDGDTVEKVNDAGEKQGTEETVQKTGDNSNITDTAQVSGDNHTAETSTPATSSDPTTPQSNTTSATPDAATAAAPTIDQKSTPTKNPDSTDNNTNTNAAETAPNQMRLEFKKSSTALSIYDCSGRAPGSWPLVMRKDVKLMYYVISLTEFLNANALQQFGFVSEATNRSNRSQSSADLNNSERDSLTSTPTSPRIRNAPLSPTQSTIGLTANSSQNGQTATQPRWNTRADQYNKHVRKNILLFTNTINSHLFDRDTEVVVVFSKYDLLVKHLFHQKQQYKLNQALKEQNAAEDGSLISNPSLANIPNLTPLLAHGIATNAANNQPFNPAAPPLILFNEIFPNYTGDNFDPHEVSNFLIKQYMARLSVQNKDVLVLAPQSGLVYLNDQEDQLSIPDTIEGVTNVSSPNRNPDTKPRRKTIFTFDLEDIEIPPELKQDGNGTQAPAPIKPIATSSNDDAKRESTGPLALSDLQDNKSAGNTDSIAADALSDHQKAVLRQEILLRNTVDCSMLYLEPISRLVLKNAAAAQAGTALTQ